MGIVVEVDAAEITGTSNFETQRTRQQATTRVETASALGLFGRHAGAAAAHQFHLLTDSCHGDQPQCHGAKRRARGAFFPAGSWRYGRRLLFGWRQMHECGDSSRCDAGETAFWDIGTLPPGRARPSRWCRSPLRAIRTAACFRFSVVRSPIARRISGTGARSPSTMAGRWSWRLTPTVSRSPRARRCATS